MKTGLTFDNTNLWVMLILVWIIVIYLLINLLLSIIIIIYT